MAHLQDAELLQLADAAGRGARALLGGDEAH